VLLLSVDPAHSLGDALALAVGDRERKVGGQLFARELDAMAAFRAQRERYRDAVDELFDTLRGGSRFDASFDRAVVHDLIDLAPPGLDELFAVWTLIDTLVGPKPRYDLIVLDLAPTGHAIRLLELPAAAHEWVRALLRILLKYRETVGLGELGSDLVELSRGLTRLEQLLRDPDGTRCVVVTRAAELPRRETVRLLAALRRLGITVAAQVVNAVTPGSCARCRRAAARERVEIRALPARPPRWLAPARVPPPRGLAALRHFGQSWHRWAA